MLYVEKSDIQKSVQSDIDIGDIFDISTQL